MENPKSNLLIITESFNFEEYKSKIFDILLNLEKHTKGINFLACN